MASTVKIIVDAGRLRVLLGGTVDLADETMLARALDILAGYTPDEQTLVAAKAVELGADPIVVQSIMGILTPEVIEIHGRAPRRGRVWLWLALLVGGAAATGGGLGYRDRRRRGVLLRGW